MNRPDLVATCETAKCVVGALLMATSEEVHEKLTRLDKGQPGSVLRALRLTRDRLTGERGSEIMLKGPTAERLTERVNELVGNVGLVGARVFDLSEEDREHANRAPIALSIPLHDELVRASSTLDRLLGKAVELRNWREDKEAELASLVETSDLDANAIREQRRAEIAGEITSVSQRETDLLGDVYEVSNAIRQRLEELSQLLSNVMRLGLGPIPTSQVIFQSFTKEQLAGLSIEERARVWLRMAPQQRDTMIETSYADLRNLDGLPLADREKMQERFVRDVFRYGPEEDREWLISMGFLRRDGEPGRRFVMLDLDNKKYVTVHGCTSYEDIQVHLEGTGTNPSDPDGFRNLNNLDKKAQWAKDGGDCVAHLLYRNAEFPQWLGINMPYLNTGFSEADQRAFNKFIVGASESGAGSKYFDTRFHSAGNGMVPDFREAHRVDRIVMDDPAINAFFKPGRKLPNDPEILVFRQEGVVSALIGASDQIPEALLPNLLPPPISMPIKIAISGKFDVESNEDAIIVDVPKTQLRHEEEDREFNERLKNSNPILKFGRYVKHELDQGVDRIVPTLNSHSDGWTNEWQWHQENFRRQACV
jgi:hypothetical protein